MSHHTSTAPVEAKVSAATAVSLLASLVLAILNAVAADSTILGDIHPTLQALLLVLIPPLVVFLGGYVAPHTPRALPDFDDGM